MNLDEIMTLNLNAYYLVVENDLTLIFVSGCRIADADATREREISSGRGNG